MKKNNLKKANKYYMQKGYIAPIVMQHLRSNKGVLYGARALNEHMPPHLDKHTSDFDVYSKKPKIQAKKLEKELDKKLGGDYFKVKKAKYPHTTKVVSKVTGETIADFTKPKEKIPQQTSIDGINYARLRYIKRKLLRILKDRASKYRWKKDREALKRIHVYEKHYGRVE